MWWIHIGRYFFRTWGLDYIEEVLWNDYGTHWGHKGTTEDKEESQDNNENYNRRLWKKDSQRQT